MPINNFSEKDYDPLYQADAKDIKRIFFADKPTITESEILDNILQVSNANEIEVSDFKFMKWQIYKSFTHALKTITKPTQIHAPKKIIDAIKYTNDMFLDAMGMTAEPSEDYLNWQDTEEDWEINRNRWMIKDISSFDTNLEIYNLLFYGNNGRNIPSAAYRAMRNSDTDSLYL